MIVTPKDVIANCVGARLNDSLGLCAAYNILSALSDAGYVVVPMKQDTNREFERGSWDALNQVLNWLNTLTVQNLDKKDIYAAIMDMRPSLPASTGAHDMNVRDTAIANACLQSIENFCMRANPETFRAELEKQGYVVVPREPSIEMLQNGRDAYRATQLGGLSGMTIEAQIRAQCRREAACWNAMLSAAQEPQP